MSWRACVGLQSQQDFEQFWWETSRGRYSTGSSEHIIHREWCRSPLVSESSHSVLTSNCCHTPWASQSNTETNTHRHSSTDSYHALINTRYLCRFAPNLPQQRDSVCSALLVHTSVPEHLDSWRVYRKDFHFPNFQTWLVTSQCFKNGPKWTHRETDLRRGIEERDECVCETKRFFSQLSWINHLFISS